MMMVVVVMVVMMPAGLPMLIWVYESGTSHHVVHSDFVPSVWLPSSSPGHDGDRLTPV
jgi:hypothetical protein